MIRFSVRHIPLFYRFLSCAVWACLICAQAAAAPQPVEVRDGLRVPWGMTWWDADHMIISERGGRLLRWHRSRDRLETLSGLPPIAVHGQGGLLDVQAYPPLHWQQGVAQWLYLTYSKRVAEDRYTTVLARARIRGAALEDWQELLVTKAANDEGRHFGSRIAFDGDGHVFVSVGDRGERDWAQALDRHAGKVLRLNLDGTVPENNPFVGRNAVLPEIFSYGHRNPQGIAYDEARNQLWVMEHGPRGGDELNRVDAGKNYGWPVISYGKEYWAPIAVGEDTHKPGMEQPVYYYDPSIAPGSLLLYRGSALPGWQRSFLSGALKLTHVNQLVLNAEHSQVREEKRWFEALNERVRALLESPEGWLYFSTDSGRIYLVKPD